FGSLGASAMSPVVRAPMLSVRGTQVGLAAVALVVFQMPPEAAPMYRIFGSVGWAAIADVRPLHEMPPGAVPLLIGVGPRGVQETALSGIEFDGARRSSNRSSCRSSLVLLARGDRQRGIGLTSR